MKSQRHGFVAASRMKDEQYRNHARTVVIPMLGTGITLHDKAVIGKRAEIVEAIEIRANLAPDPLRELRTGGLEYRPTGCAGNRIDDPKTEPADREARKLAVPF